MYYRYGVRNSLLLAPMPTASTAQILGNNESIEAYTNNIYTRRVLSGEFQVSDNILTQIVYWNLGIFLGLNLGRILVPSQFIIEQKLPKIVKIIPNFLVLYFGENFIKIRTKIPKLQMHENVNENMFSFLFLCKFS